MSNFSGRSSLVRRRSPASHSTKNGRNSPKTMATVSQSAGGRVLPSNPWEKKGETWGFLQVPGVGCSLGYHWSISLTWLSLQSNLLLKAFITVLLPCHKTTEKQISFNISPSPPGNFLENKVSIIFPGSSSFIPLSTSVFRAARLLIIALFLPWLFSFACLPPH